MTGGAIHKAGMKAVSKIIKSEYARRTVVKIAQNSKFNPINVSYTIVGRTSNYVNNKETKSKLGRTRFRNL